MANNGLLPVLKTRKDFRFSWQAIKETPADAIPGAANYLAANGTAKGGKHLERALWADWYVRKVLDRAEEYAAPPPANAARGTIVVRAALKRLGTPYSWGGGSSKGPTYGI